MAQKQPSFQHKIAGQSGFKKVDEVVRTLPLSSSVSVPTMSNSSSCTILPVSNVAQQNMSSGVSSEATHSAGLSASIHNNPPEVRHQLVFVIIAVLFILCHNALIDCPQLNKNGKKRRKYNRNKSLSKKAKGGNSKTVLPNAPKASFIRQASAPHSAAPKLSSKQKSLHNKVQYQRHLNKKATEQMKTLSSTVTSLEKEKSLLVSDNKKLTEDLTRAAAASTKSAQMLQDRTDRWMSWRDRSHEEIAKVKRAASRRIAALQKKHQVELTKERSLQYRTEREHTKHLVALGSELEKASASADKKVNTLEKDCESKVALVM